MKALLCTTQTRTFALIKWHIYCPYKRKKTESLNHAVRLIFVPETKIAFQLKNANKNNLSFIWKGGEVCVSGQGVELKD